MPISDQSQATYILFWHLSWERRWWIWGVECSSYLDRYHPMTECPQPSAYPPSPPSSCSWECCASLRSSPQWSSNSFCSPVVPPVTISQIDVQLPLTCRYDREVIVIIKLLHWVYHLLQVVFNHIFFGEVGIHWPGRGYKWGSTEINIMSGLTLPKAGPAVCWLLLPRKWGWSDQVSQTFSSLTRAAISKTSTT